RHAGAPASRTPTPRRHEQNARATADLAAALPQQGLEQLSSWPFHPSPGHLVVPAELFLGACKTKESVALARRRLVQFANLALAIAGKFEESLGPLDRLFLRFDLKQREAADHFLRLGEGTVGHGELSFGDPDPRAFRARLASLGGEEHAGLGHLFDELSHR